MSQLRGQGTMLMTFLMALSTIAAAFITGLLTIQAALITGNLSIQAARVGARVEREAPPSASLEPPRAARQSASVPTPPSWMPKPTEPAPAPQVRKSNEPKPPSPPPVVSGEAGNPRSTPIPPLSPPVFHPDRVVTKSRGAEQTQKPPGMGNIVRSPQPKPNTKPLILGVRLSPDSGHGMVVEGVIEDSPASRIIVHGPNGSFGSRLIKGDTISLANQRPIHDVTDLRRAIAECITGELEISGLDANNGWRTSYRATIRLFTLPKGEGLQ